MTHNSVLELTRHIPRLTLKEMTLLRITTTLCNNRQLLDLILSCDFPTNVEDRSCIRNGSNWKAVEAKANKLVSQICMPVLLKNKILEFLWPVSYRILSWKSVYAPSLNKRFLQRFFFTDHGRVDNAKTVKCIIGNRNISVRERFVLACSVCSSPEIHEIWREMSNEDKAYFDNQRRHEISPLLRFWLYILSGSDLAINALQQYIEDALEVSINIGLLQAVKYLIAESSEYDSCANFKLSYFGYLAYKLKENHFIEEDENDIGHFLFCEMTNSQQDVVFNEYTLLILSLLLHSSKFELCLRLFKERIGIIEDDYEIARIIYMIFYYYHLEVFRNYDCGKLFIDLWRVISTSYRSSDIPEELGVEFLSLLIRDNFPFILEKGALKKIEEFTSSDSMCVEEFDFHEEKWKLLLFLVEEKIVTIPRIDSSNWTISTILNVSPSNKTVWNRIKEFVLNVGSESMKLNKM